MGAAYLGAHHRCSDRVAGGAWYRCHCLVEACHYGLKCGCSLERRQRRDETRLERLPGVLAPMAVYPLQLRARSRSEL